MTNPQHKSAALLDVVLDEDAADLLRQTIGDDDDAAPIRLLVGGGHSGYGLYVAHAEYQEEGAVLLCELCTPAPLTIADEAVNKAAVPPVEDLLVMAVECGLIRMSKVMDADLQDMLTAFAKRLTSTTSPLPLADDMRTLGDRLADEADQCRNDGATDIAKLLDEAREALVKVHRPTVTEGIQWPVARELGRIGDMSPSATLRVGLDGDNDVYVSVWDESGNGSIEFCCPGAGGGNSPKTRMALIALMRAMEADNAASPHKDWWTKRMKDKAPE